MFQAGSEKLIVSLDCVAAKMLYEDAKRAGPRNTEWVIGTRDLLARMTSKSAVLSTVPEAYQTVVAHLLLALRAVQHGVCSSPDVVITVRSRSDRSLTSCFCCALIDGLYVHHGSVCVCFAPDCRCRLQMLAAHDVVDRPDREPLSLKWCVRRAKQIVDVFSERAGHLPGTGHRISGFLESIVDWCLVGTVDKSDVSTLLGQVGTAHQDSPRCLALAV